MRAEFALGEIALDKLANTPATAYNVLQNNAGTISWVKPSYLNFDDRGITLAKLLPGTAYKVPQVNSGVTAFEEAYPKVLQRVRTEITSAQEIATVYALGNWATAPTVAQMAEITGLYVAITPLVASSKLRIKIYVQACCYNSSVHVLLGLCKDSDTAVLRLTAETIPDSQYRRLTLEYLMDTPAVGASITFKALGTTTTANYFRINSLATGGSPSAFLSSKAASFIEVEEVI